VSPDRRVDAWLRARLAQAAGWAVDLPPRLGEEDAGRLWEHVRRQRLLAWLAVEVGPSACPAALAPDLAAEASYAARHSLVRAEGLRRLVRLTREIGVEVVFLKGAAIAPILYANPSARSMRDLDLWVRDVTDAERLQRVLRERGFRSGGSLGATHHHLDPLRDLSEAFLVEVHTQLAVPGLSEAARSALWKGREFGPGGLPRLHPAGRFLHHALHALNDPVDGGLLRDLWETARLAEGLNELEWDLARDWARDHGETARIGSVLRLAEEAFGWRRAGWPSGPPTFAGRCAAVRLASPIPRTRLARLARHWRAGTLCRWQQNPSRAPATLGLVEGLATVGGHLARLGHRLRQRLFPRLVAAEGRGLDWPEARLLHRADTGEVHLLNDLSRRLVAACATPRPLRAVLRAVDDPQARACLQALLRAGVIQRA
jgi:hypothetical protein